MRIVHILHGKVNPDSLNGVSKAGHWMATYQHRLGHDVEVWGLADSKTLTPRPREYRMRLFPISRLRMTLARELRAAVDELELDTWVHFHSVFCPEFPAVAAILRARGILYGVTPHGGYSPAVLARHRLRKSLYIALRERRYLAGASLVQALGQNEVLACFGLAPALDVALIPNGQTAGLLDEIEVPAMEAERPVIGYCGRLAIRQKGLDFLVRGFTAYKSEGGRGELWLIGDGEERAAVEQMVEQSGLIAHVRFFGSMTGTAKLQVIANLDAFIHSSRWEGLPTACLEAASVGRPLLVSRETNLGECVERCAAGLVLDETSAAGVARVLGRSQQLFEDGALLEMGLNARALVLREFSWEANARGFIAAIASARALVERVPCGVA